MNDAWEDNSESSENAALQAGNSLGDALLNAVPVEVSTTDTTEVGSSIYEIIINDNLAKVTYYAPASEEHSIVVAIYDESGKKQLATGKKKVSIGEEVFHVVLQGTIGVETTAKVSQTFVEATGEYHECIVNTPLGCITKNNRILMWGYNKAGRMGNGEFNRYVNKPYEVDTEANGPESLSVEQFFFSEDSETCTAIDTDGNLWMWGENKEKCITSKEILYVTEPTLVLFDIKEFKMVDSYGKTSYFALSKFGDLYAWGNNDYNILGLNQTEYPRVTGDAVYRMDISNVKEFYVDISCNTGVCLLNNGTLWIWGRDWSKNVKKDDVTRWETFQQMTVGELEKIDKVYLQKGTIAVLAENGRVYKGGYKRVNYNDSFEKPTLVNGIEGAVKEVYIESGTVAVLTENHKLYMWGSNTGYQLGEGTDTERSEAVAVLPEEEIEEFKFLLKGKY